MQNPVPDVPESNGYFKYVQKMKDEGITGNVGTYNCTDVMISEHMAAFLARTFLWGDKKSQRERVYFKAINIHPLFQ